ncbi:MAG: glycosyltransferase family 1 protein [Desulfobacteraceae bacterium]|jgi:glycosyltransferase involved in cell wall biosynthesis|nr:glycosyltransferase family 1 protein [Desulfobacteraceae bacterium]
MNLVINALSARMGGGQTYLVNLLRHPPDPGRMQLFVYAPSSLALPGQENVTRLHPAWPTDNPAVRTLWEKTVLPRVLRRLGAQVLFCPGGVVATRAPRGCHTATMFRNMIPFDPVQRRRYPPGYQRLRNWLLNQVMLESMVRADRVIFISAHARRVIEKAAGRPLTRAVVIPHGVNPMFRDATAASGQRPRWLPDEYLLYVSTIDRYKAQVEVVQAYAHLCRMRPTGEKLVLVGHETPGYGRRVRREIARLGLEGKVVLAGAVEYSRMPAVYRQAKVHIFASESENCPNILLEAMAAGGAILASSRPPMPEFGGDGVIYFDPSRPRQLAARIAELIDDAPARTRLGAEAKARVACYDWGLTARRTWEALYALSSETS